MFSSSSPLTIVEPLKKSIHFNMLLNVFRNIQHLHFIFIRNSFSGVPFKADSKLVTISLEKFLIEQRMLSDKT